MKKVILLVAILFTFSTSAIAEDGLVRYESHYTVAQTADRFVEIAKSKGLTVFIRIDHQENAAGVNLDLRPTEVIIFGNPRVGTPLMQCDQDVAIDLPQKMMVSEDASGQVWLTYNDPKYLMNRHDIEGCDEVIGKISNVLNTLAETAVAQ